MTQNSPLLIPSSGEPDARAYVGLGSNLGDRLSNLQRAVDLLGSREAARPTRSSRVYETEPVGPPQPLYLNAVIQVETMVGPRELLEICLDVEREMRRTRGERWGPRKIDLDLLSFEDRSVEEPGLRLPHPRMHERGFVLIPLIELSADPVLPGGKKLSSLRLPASFLGGVRLYAPPLRIR